MRLGRLIVCIAVGLCWQSALADDPQTPARKAEAKDAQPKIARADLGSAYLRLDHAFAKNPPTDPRQIAEINQAFDKSTLAFFGGKYAETLETIDELTRRLVADCDGECRRFLRGAQSLKVEFEPPVQIAGQPGAKATIRALYQTQRAGPLRCELALASPERQIVVAQPFELALGESLEMQVDLSSDAARLLPGRYEALLVSKDNRENSLGVGYFTVVPDSLDAQRERLSSRLQAAQPDSPELSAAALACADRLALLTDRPSSERSSQFLANPLALSADLQTEVAAIAAGNDPYRRRAGDYWRTIKSADKTIPLRVYAPAHVAGAEGVPLLVALHGAGADENMFFEGYGAGVIKQLADRHCLLVVAPNTYALAGKPEAFADLIRAVGYDYALDPARVYVLGHSMGGGAASALAGKLPDRIAAACCLAGGGRTKAPRLAPTLVIAAELDLVVPAAGLERGARQAAADGLPVELRVMQNYGHTLMVGPALPDAVAWLVEHRLAEPAGS